MKPLTYIFLKEFYLDVLAIILAAVLVAVRIKSSKVYHCFLYIEPTIRRRSEKQNRYNPSKIPLKEFLYWLNFRLWTLNFNEKEFILISFSII